MENDGITRIYFIGSDNSARLLHPEEVPLASRLLGEEAEDIRRRADYHVTNYEEWVRKESQGELALDLWFVQSALKKVRGNAPNSHYFSVCREGWTSNDRYIKLVQAIEERIGGKGFTILIYPSFQL